MACTAIKMYLLLAGESYFAMQDYPKIVAGLRVNLLDNSCVCYLSLSVLTIAIFDGARYTGSSELDLFQYRSLKCGPWIVYFMETVRVLYSNRAFMRTEQGVWLIVMCVEGCLEMLRWMYA